MNTFAISATRVAVGFAFCTAAWTQAPNSADYLAARRTLESDFRTAKIGCEPMLGHVKTVCMADVNGREVVALAELRAAYDPSEEALKEVRVVKARAGLTLARARCDEVAPHRKAACTVEAEAAHAAALVAPKAEAK